MEKLKRAYQTLNMEIDIKEQFKSPTQKQGSAVAAWTVALVVRIAEAVKNVGVNDILATHFKSDKQSFFQGMSWFIQHGDLRLNVICEHLAVVKYDAVKNRIDKDISSWPTLQETAVQYPMIANHIPVQLYLHGDPIAPVVVANDVDEANNDSVDSSIGEDFSLPEKNKKKRKRNTRATAPKKTKIARTDDSSDEDDNNSDGDYASVS